MLEEPRVIFENENFAAVDKPAGMLTHPTLTKADGAQTNAEIAQRKSALSPRRSAILTEWLVRKYPGMKNVGDEPEVRPGIVHRLDRETSGILLAAKNQSYFEYLKGLFKTRQIIKTYFALVFGELKRKTGVIEKDVMIKSGTVKRTIFSGKMAKQAITRYTVKKTFTTQDRTFSLLEVVPETGRTHQIRVHLASIGHPIVGDRLYGRKQQPAWASRLMLHAYSLEFATREGSRLKVEAEPPPEFAVQV